MLRQAERYVVAVDHEEAIFIIGLFLQAQFSEFMEIISSTLSELLELDNGFSERVWPLQSRINRMSISSPLSLSKSEMLSRGGLSGSKIPSSPGSTNTPLVPLTARSRLRNMRIRPSRVSPASPSKFTTTEHSVTSEFHCCCIYLPTQT